MRDHEEHCHWEGHVTSGVGWGGGADGGDRPTRCHEGVATRS